MDKGAVEQHARTHGDAVVAGDLQTAGSSLTREARDQAGAVMKALPKNLTGATVEMVDEEGEGLTARIEYSGDGDSVIVESVWAERDGEPKIVALRVL
jgi:hypothetical protein